MKKILSLLLAVAMLASICLTGCSKAPETPATDAPQDKPEATAAPTEAPAPELEEATIQVWIGGPGKQKDSDEVWEKFNEVLQNYVPNTTVEFSVMTTAEYGPQFEQMLAAGEPVDLAWIASWVTGRTQANIDDGNLMPMSELLDTYGQGIKEELGDAVVDIHREADGELYYLPCWQGLYQTKRGIYLPTELGELAGPTWIEDATRIVDEWYNVNPSPENFAKVMDQFIIYLQAAKDAGKLYGGLTNSKFMGWNYTQNQGVGAEWVGISRLDNTFTVHDFVADEHFKVACEKFAEMYQKGLIREDIASLDTSGFAFVTNGEFTDNTCILFQQNYLSEHALQSMEKAAGMPISVIPIERAGVLGKGDATATAIPYCADEPERAMMVLNAIYTVPELYQLLIYGIEGKHYTDNGDGTVTTSYGAEGTAEADYGLWRWTIGTCRHSLVTQADTPGYYQALSDAEKTAGKNIFADFVFDRTNVEDVMSALAALRLEYEPILKQGYTGADWEATYNKYIEERQKAGLDRLMEEFTKQIQAYMAEKGITSW